MITHLSINNLKLHDHTDLELNGLTILTGMNGMGKSTVIQSLILLRQSFMMNDLDSGLNLKVIVRRRNIRRIGLSGFNRTYFADKHEVCRARRFEFCI